MATERIQKIIAKAGIASRRGAEELISDSLVTVNGKVAKLGDKAEWGKDAIKVKGKLIHWEKSTQVYLALHKPRGVISALSDPQSRPNLSDYLGKLRTRVFPVGRLDFNSEGLILLTNDGDFAEEIQKKKDITRVYEVKIKGHPDDRLLAKLKKGAMVGVDKSTTVGRATRKRLLKPLSVTLKEKLENKAWIEVVVLGGAAFDVKGLFETTGFLVERIVRTSIGTITLKGLAPGEIRHLKPNQVTASVKPAQITEVAPARIRARE